MPVAEVCPICEQQVASVLAVQKDDLLVADTTLYEFLTEYKQRCTMVVSDSDGEKVAMCFFHEKR